MFAIVLHILLSALGFYPICCQLDPPSPADGRVVPDGGVRTRVRWKGDRTPRSRKIFNKRHSPTGFD
jgi:hypothetical protein